MVLDSCARGAAPTLATKLAVVALGTNAAELTVRCSHPIHPQSRRKTRFQVELTNRREL